MSQPFPTDEFYMRRALQLAACGCQGASPNPMVGAVVVDAEGLIVGEGFHRRCGGPHAEVNAVNAVRRRMGEMADEVLRSSTVYVTLEPCSHYGKTPPCAKLLVECAPRRVVVGVIDPFARVSGRGIAMLRDAGIDVTTGVLERECRELNRRFFTAHTFHRPWVTLKWAQSADGFIDVRRSPEVPAVRFSSPLGSTLVHRMRSLHDAIIVGTGTVIMDRPRLDARLWPSGRAPRVVVNDRRCRISHANPEWIFTSCDDVAGLLADIYSRGFTSLLVEGGAGLLSAFIESGLWDEARVEVSPVRLHDGIQAPSLPAGAVSTRRIHLDGNVVSLYSRG